MACLYLKIGNFQKSTFENLCGKKIRKSKNKQQ